MFVFFSHPLPRSVYLAFKARKGFLHGGAHRSYNSSLRQCERAGELLRESLNMDGDEEHYFHIKTV